MPDAAAVTATVTFVTSSGLCCGDFIVLSFSSGPIIPCSASNFLVLSTTNGTLNHFQPNFVQCIDANRINVSFSCRDSSGCPITNAKSVSVHIQGWQNPPGPMPPTSVTVISGLDNINSVAGVGPTYVQAAPFTTPSTPSTSASPPPITSTPSPPACSYDSNCGCPPGCSLNSGSLSCNECSKGFYSSACTNASNSCVICPAGSYCEPGRRTLHLVSIFLPHDNTCWNR